MTEFDMGSAVAIVAGIAFIIFVVIDNTKNGD